MDHEQAPPETGLKLDRGVGAEFAAGERRALQVPHLLRHRRSGRWKSPKRNGRRRTGCNRRSSASEAVAAVRIELRCAGDLTFAKLGARRRCAST